jgi:hypothetical protein
MNYAALFPVDVRLLCTVCGEGDPVDTTDTGYCPKCRELLAREVDEAIESIMPIVVVDGGVSGVLDVLWRSGWRLAPRSTRTIPRCGSCQAAPIDLRGAMVDLAGAIDRLVSARQEDEDMARLRMHRTGPEQLRRWIELCARVSHNVFASMSRLNHCVDCHRKKLNDGPRIVRG